MVARALIALIRVYQLTLSKLIRATLGNVCRFEPSCSRYAVACLQGHGALRGSLLSVKRLCRCHPFHPGGFDPPPPPRDRAIARAVPVVSLSAEAPAAAGVLSAGARVPAGEVSAHAPAARAARPHPDADAPAERLSDPPDQPNQPSDRRIEPDGRP